MSLGTGYFGKASNANNRRTPVFWLTNINNAYSYLLDGPTHDLCSVTRARDGENFFRWQVPFWEGIAMDDCRPEILNAMEDATLMYLDELDFRESPYSIQSLIRKLEN